MTCARQCVTSRNCTTRQNGIIAQCERIIIGLCTCGGDAAAIDLYRTRCIGKYTSCGHCSIKGGGTAAVDDQCTQCMCSADDTGKGIVACRTRCQRKRTRRCRIAVNRSREHNIATVSRAHAHAACKGDRRSESNITGSGLDIISDLAAACAVLGKCAA